MRRFGASIFLLNLILRLWIGANFLSTPYSEFTLHVNGPDQNYYYRWAKSIAAGSWSWEESPAGRPFYASPFYSFLMSLSMKWADHPFWGLLFLQCLCSSMTVFVFLDWGRRLGPRGTGHVAAILWTFYGVSYFYDACLIRDSLVASFTLFAIWGWLRIWDKPGIREALTAGFLLGVLTILRPNIFFVILPAGLLMAAIWKRNTSFARAALLMGLAAAVCVAPFLARNVIVSGKWIPISSQGPDALMLGNDPQGPGVGMVPTENSKRMLDATRGSFAGSLRVIAQEARRDPAGFAQLYSRKLRMLANDYEIPANYSYYVFRKLVPAGWLWIGWGLALAFAAWGLCSQPRSVPWRLVLPVTILALSILTIHIQSRYRFPLASFAIWFAGRGIVGLWQTLRPFAPLKMATATVVIAGILWLTQSDPSFGYYIVKDSRGSEHKLTEPIHTSDYVTWILSLWITDKDKHEDEIKRLTQEAHAIYSNEFTQMFKSSADGLFRRADQILTPEYRAKYRIVPGR